MTGQYYWLNNQFLLVNIINKRAIQALNVASNKTSKNKSYNLQVQ